LVDQQLLENEALLQRARAAASKTEIDGRHRRDRTGHRDALQLSVER
jgi:hypothetical protein